MHISTIWLFTVQRGSSTSTRSSRCSPVRHSRSTCPSATLDKLPSLTSEGKLAGGMSDHSKQKYLQFLNSPFPRPENLCSFLGMACSSAVFVGTSWPLYNLSAECQDAFNSIKTLLCSAPVLTAPDVAHPFKLEVDASAIRAGSALLQEDCNGVDHPVCYFSRKFNRYQPK